MNKEDWASLQACPGWDALKRYLMDCRSQTMERIARGTYEDDALSAAILECQVWLKAATLEWKDIAGFYDLEPTNEA